MFPIAGKFAPSIDAARVVVVLFPSDPVTRKMGFLLSSRKISKSEVNLQPFASAERNSCLSRRTEGEKISTSSCMFCAARSSSKIPQIFRSRGKISRLIFLSERKITGTPVPESIESSARLDFPMPKKPKVRPP